MREGNHRLHTFRRTPVFFMRIRSELQPKSRASSVAPQAGESASLPGTQRPSYGGPGGDKRPRMKRWLSYALLVVGIAVLTLVAFTPSNASAEKRTFQVRLADQTIITVTVDVPPGTPINLIPLPGVVVAEIPNPTGTPSPVTV